jgi:hypothetical protein
MPSDLFPSRDGKKLDSALRGVHATPTAAFLDGRWYTMDARHNHPRIGRIVMDEVATRRTSRCRQLSESQIWRVLKW